MHKAAARKPSNYDSNRVSETQFGLHCRMKGDKGDRIRRNPLGLGLLLGGAVFSYGKQCGCKKAEILAINDDGKPQHESSRSIVRQAHCWL